MPKKKALKRSWEGLPDLEPHLRPIDTLKPMQANAMRHSERQISAFMNALDQLGQHRPAVIDKLGTVLIGNGMLEAARRLQWTHLACITSTKKNALRALTDNAISDLGTWDQAARAQMLKDLVDGGEDLRLFGWTQADLDKELQAAMEGLTDEIQDLAQDIESEEPTNADPDPLEVAQALSDKISKRLHRLAKEKPEALTKAQGLIVDRQGGKALFCLIDPNTKDAIVELKRLAQDPPAIPEGSPLAAFMEGINT
ncbi:MAG: hypothetical protein ACLFUL_14605 [Desulfobacteraceae bacterium]